MTSANALFLDGEHTLVVTPKMLVLHLVGNQLLNIILENFVTDSELDNSRLFFLIFVYGLHNMNYVIYIYI